MNADDYPVENVLAEPRRFMVPLYQRKYQWGDERLIPFWEDVEAKAVEVLEGDSKFEHYMGALILAPIGENAQIGVTPKVQVVDGQQRLTTFQLFLAAIREVARKHTFEDVIAYVNDYLYNQKKSKDNDPLTRFKLTPTPSDREVFHDILDKEYVAIRKKYAQFYWGNGVPKNTSMRALRAYEVFKQKAEQFVALGAADDNEVDDYERSLAGDDETRGAQEERLEALLKALLNRMKLVVITLGEGDDAQVIFETLNSKGEPLLAMDLVRNNIFHRAEKEGNSADELYRDLWDPFDHTWWREAAPNARPKRPRIDHFLAHVLTATTGEKIAMRELYAEYRSFAVPRGRPRFSEVEDELKLLQGYAPIYETLEGRKSTDDMLAWIGRKLSTWQVTTAYPIAMQIASSAVGDDERRRIYSLLYSYIVRRALCGLTAKNLNRVFQLLAHQFVADGVSIETFRKFFGQRTGESTKFPSDEDFRRGILIQPAYLLAPGMRIKDVLWELETASRTRFAEKTTMPSGLQTEHVMPVSWTEGWPFEVGDWVSRDTDDPRAVSRNRIVHTLGNLTLITAGLNSSVGNKSFAGKKKMFSEHTGLYLNRYFLEVDNWNESFIDERSRKLADKAIAIWPGLDSSSVDLVEEGELLVDY